MTNSPSKIQNSKAKPTDSWVIDEARRCLACYDPPCQKACPALIPIPEFIRAIGTGNTRYSAAIIRNANPLAAICGKVCPEEVFCQSQCTRASIDAPLKIRELHSWATSSERQHEIKLSSSARVAIIGGGPAGISCAVNLKKAGIDAAIFESASKSGGVPRNSIPEFRLPDEVIDSDIYKAKELGIEINISMPIENPNDLLGKYEAVLIAAGLPCCKKLGIPGEDGDCVISSLSFLEDARQSKIKSLSRKRVLVIGGGNVSLDAASMAAELDAEEVRLMYRRGPAEMKVWESERREAANRGVIIEYLSSPIEFLKDSDKLTGLKCIKTKLSDKLDSSSRRVAIEIPGSEFIIKADIAIVAIGMTSDFLRSIKTNADMTTSHLGIFVAGDIARGEGTIVEAVADGKLAALKIIEYIRRGQQ